jgi:formylglycine-generating enzyme required for sulfatase activity
MRPAPRGAPLPALRTVSLLTVGGLLVLVAALQESPGVRIDASRSEAVEGHIFANRSPAGEPRAACPPRLLAVADQMRRQYPTLAGSSDVRGVHEAAMRRGLRPNAQPDLVVARWIQHLERTHDRARRIPASLQRLRDLLYRRHTLSESRVPESAIELQRRIARDRGHGDVTLTPEIRREFARRTVEAQRASLDSWVDYFLSPDTDSYPFEFKVWAFHEIVRLQGFDPASHSFPRRSGTTTGPFPELNREALAAVFGRRQQQIDARQPPEAFARMYALEVTRLREAALAAHGQRGITDGEWVRYPRGSDPAPLVATLCGKNTGWCTANASTAAGQLANGDFHVYYSNDASGRPTVPRIAIRMEGERIGEVRGVDGNQNLDPVIAGTDILSNRLREFGPEGERYAVRTEHMARLTEIDRNARSGQELSPEDLRFLYEVDHPIEGFGYNKDPRIAEIRGNRDLRRDVARIAGVRDLAEARSLKNGTPEERLRYIAAMRAMEATGLRAEVDPQFASTLDAWLSDSNQPFSVRRQVALELFDAGTARSGSALHSRPLPELLDHFTRAEQQTLIETFMGTPRQRGAILLAGDPLLLDLMLRVRELPQARARLLEAYGRRFQTQVAHILDDASISNEAAARLVPRVVEALGGWRLGQMTEAMQRIQADAPALAPWLETQLIQTYWSNRLDQGTVMRDLIRGIASEDPVVQRFTLRVLAASDRAELRNSSVLRSVLQLSRGEGPMDVRIQRWLANEGVSPEAKAELMIAHFGARNRRFFAMEEALPASQRSEVWDEINRQSSIGLYVGRARNRGLDASVFDGASAESFLYVRPRFPEGRSRTFTMGEGAGAHDVTLTEDVSMQATQLTQLQWFLMTGRNPSRFSGAPHAEGDHIVINGVAMNANHPVEQVSWNDIQEYITALNAEATRLGHTERYRLPTEAEWEASARAGSTTTYSFGNDAAELNRHGWYSGNSADPVSGERRTHAVAQLRPNPGGLSDAHGNVWEWVEDRYGEYSPGPATNPRGPASGAFRVFRGGSWFNGAGNLGSAYRNSHVPSYRYGVLGFRLVRTTP